MSRRLTVGKDQEARQLATKKKTFLRRPPELAALELRTCRCPGRLLRSRVESWPKLLTLPKRRVTIKAR
jgi:hypothetical protein